MKDFIQLILILPPHTDTARTVTYIYTRDLQVCSSVTLLKCISSGYGRDVESLN